MKNKFFTIGLVALLFAACSVNEMDIATPAAKEAEEFFATIEDASTKVFVDDELMVLWHADDRVSIFNKYTYNQQYRFTGNTGANSGSFTKVPNDDFVTGNTLNSVYAIYPYKESTEISNQGVLTIDLPATQSYAENSFGIGANTMVSCSEGNELLFKNLCGYIMLKLYGNDVSVKSISIKGNNDEPLAGKAAVNASIDNAPTISFNASTTKEITLTFDTPVTLGSTAETATTFWLVVPPTTFSKGITVTVKDDKYGEFKKSTTASLQISRNTLKRMSALQVTPEPSDDAIVFADSKLKDRLVAKFDTNGDGELSYKEAAAVTSIEGAVTIATIISFDEFQYFTGVNYIPENCFKNWSKLTSIILPNSLTSIGNSAFNGCSNLPSISIPESVTSIGEYAFYCCSSLVSINIPQRVRSIEDYTFYNCSSLTSIVIPESVTSIKHGAFGGCRGLTSIVIPKRVTSIGEFAFSGCEGLTSIVIPESVTKIWGRAFSGCKGLTSIVIPESVTSIDLFEMFSYCSSLTSVVIPESATSIGDRAFTYCTSLSSIVIPESVTSIEREAFSGCTGLSSIVIPESVTSIEREAFSGCTGLSSIVIPESVTSIEREVFSGCTGLTSVVIPESVTWIGEGALSGCTGLTSIIIPESVTSIGNEAFSGCTGLTSIVIPKGMTFIGKNAFMDCTSLTSVVISEGVTSIWDYTFNGCTNLTSIVIPESVTSIGEYTFKECLGLTSIVIPESLTSIGKCAFFGCTGLTSIIIPESVTSIGGYAFSDCSNLNEIYCLGETTPSGGHMMFYNTNNCPIFVPKESVEAYKITEYWSDYADRIQPIAPLPQAVDMGLSVKWASFNLGATKPEEYGDYYAWGETEPYYSSFNPLTWKEGKDAGYDWDSYIWFGGSTINTQYTFTKYCTKTELWNGKGSPDGKTVLDPEDDAAHVFYGANWRMPTVDEIQELENQCTWEWTTINGIKGEIVTGPNGNSIFLPAAGSSSSYNPVSIIDCGSRGAYWSSSYGGNIQSYGLGFNDHYVGEDYQWRCVGYSIRPVSD